MNIDQINQNCLVANGNYFEDAKLVDVNSMADYYSGFSLTKGKFDISGPIIANFVQDDKRINYSAAPCHALIVGGTGTGKTQCYFSAQAEAIVRSVNQPSVFFMDLKGDYYSKFSDFYKRNGYKVYVLNLKEPFQSNRYNPLDPAWHSYQNSILAKKLLDSAEGIERVFRKQKYDSFEEWRAAVQTYRWEQMEICQNFLRRLATMFVPVESTKDPSWEHGARQMFYLQAIGLLEDSEYPERGMIHDKFTIANVIRVATCTEDDCEKIHEWIDARDKTSAVKGLYSYYTKHARTTREGYISTFATKLDRWKNISTDWVTSKSDIDVEEIVSNFNKQKVAIFCITDETRSESYDICMTFIDHLISAMKIHHDKVGPANRDLYILADEFANMPALPNIANRISTLRSYRVWLHMGIQSFDQLDDKYGEKIRAIIIDNCDTQIFFGTNNSKTVREFALSMGDKAAAVTSYSVGNDGKLALSITAMDRPLIRQSDLTSLKLGEAYVKVFRKPAVFTKLDPHFACKDLCQDDTPPEKIIYDLSELDKIYYDIRLPEVEKPKRKFEFDF